MKRVVVLGCGPSGLLAAHAASMEGADVQIFSHKTPSYISGAQYLHERIPGLTMGIDGHILFTKTGSASGYAKKVYGSSSMDTSWDRFDIGVSRPAWSMQKAYKRLWAMYKDAISDYHVSTPGEALALEGIGADLFITSLPQAVMCSNPEHIFESVPMHIVPDGDPAIAWVPENTVIYNGHPGIAWSRASNLFGHVSIEFPRTPPFHVDNLLHGFKPTMHNCDCNPHWLRVGRFGQWKRGVLVHHAFKEVTDAMHQMQ